MSTAALCRSCLGLQDITVLDDRLTGHRALLDRARRHPSASGPGQSEEKACESAEHEDVADHGDGDARHVELHSERQDGTDDDECDTAACGHDQPFDPVATAGCRRHGCMVPTCTPVSYTHLRAHETDSYLVCRLLLEKKKKKQKTT